MKNEILELTKELISISSARENKRQQYEILNIIKRELGGTYSIQEFESNGIPSILVSNSKEPLKKFKLLLNAHVDVVPGQIDQFTPVEKEGKLYGRGAVDMKSAVATMILLFKELADKVPYALGLQIVTDEEHGGENGTKHQIDQGINADFVLGGDTPGLKINNEAKGVYYIKMHAKGIAAHSAYPWNGKNAAVIMTQAIHTLHELLPLPEKEVWASTASVIKIETDNNTVNTITDNCTAYVNIRYIPEEERDLLGELRRITPNEVSIEEIFSVPPEYTVKDNKYVQLLKTTMEKTLNKPAEFLKSHAQSDLRYYNIIGTPAVNLGPIGGHHHAGGEWLDIDCLEDYYNILKDFLLAVDML